MKRTCPNSTCASPDFVIRDGTFRRSEDSKNIQRFRCKACHVRFSSATFSDYFRQKRRRINLPLLKLPQLAKRCLGLNNKLLSSLKGQVHNIQIDDLITKENSNHFQFQLRLMKRGARF